MIFCYRSYLFVNSCCIFIFERPFRIPIYDLNFSSCKSDIYILLKQQIAKVLVLPVFFSRTRHISYDKMFLYYFISCILVVFIGVCTSIILRFIINIYSNTVLWLEMFLYINFSFRGKSINLLVTLIRSSYRVDET